MILYSLFTSSMLILTLTLFLKINEVLSDASKTRPQPSYCQILNDGKDIKCEGKFFSVDELVLYLQPQNTISLVEKLIWDFTTSTTIWGFRKTVYYNESNPHWKGLTANLVGMPEGDEYTYSSRSVLPSLGLWKLRTPFTSPLEHGLTSFQNLKIIELENVMAIDKSSFESLKNVDLKVSLHDFGYRFQVFSTTKTELPIVQVEKSWFQGKTPQLKSIVVSGPTEQVQFNGIKASIREDLGKVTEFRYNVKENSRSVKFNPRVIGPWRTGDSPNSEDETTRVRTKSVHSYFLDRDQPSREEFKLDDGFFLKKINGFLLMFIILVVFGAALYTGMISLLITQLKAILFTSDELSFSDTSIITPSSNEPIYFSSSTDFILSIMLLIVAVFSLITVYISFHKRKSLRKYHDVWARTTYTDRGSFPVAPAL